MSKRIVITLASMAMLLMAMVPQVMAADYSTTLSDLNSNYQASYLSANRGETHTVSNGEMLNTPNYFRNDYSAYVNVDGVDIWSVYQGMVGLKYPIGSQSFTSITYLQSSGATIQHQVQGTSGNTYYLDDGHEYLASDQSYYASAGTAIRRIFTIA